MISAEIVCDSISEQGKRLTTFKLRYPKFIHGEFMTHRVISRNASSSRAIPVKKLILEVKEDALRAGPVYWGAEQKGMQSGEELDEIAKLYAQQVWREAALNAAASALLLHGGGVHKSLVNRLLEPFSHINVVATATEWDNFFGLRLHKDAQPEMRALTVAMWETRKVSTPIILMPGRWHLPFVSYNEACELRDLYLRNAESVSAPIHADALSIKVSVARCARVSYESFETGKRSTVEEDLKLYDRLLAALKDPTQPLHASPAEHQATPDTWHPAHDYTDSRRNTCRVPDHWEHDFQHGNFVGWCQYRKMLPNEAVAPLPEGYR